MTPQQIADRLRVLSTEMIDVGTAMDYYGGMGTNMAKRGAELVSAGLITQEWVEHIEHELKGE
jgi:hypothetical protein